MSPFTITSGLTKANLCTGDTGLENDGNLSGSPPLLLLTVSKSAVQHLAAAVSPLGSAAARKLPDRDCLDSPWLAVVRCSVFPLSASYLGWRRGPNG